MIRTIKPRNAASKRALEARAPKEIEDERTVIFVKGTHVGEKVSGVMKDLMALKRPHAIAFNKKNEIRPFEDTSSLDFWANKNDAGMFAIGQSTKKRPDGLTLVRMYDGSVLDMCELGVVGYQPMSSFPGPKSTPGHRPLVHFASDLFDTHPRYIHLRSLLLDLFGGSQIDAIHLAGVEHIICVSTAPAPPSLTTTTTTTPTSPPTELPIVHIRTYTTRLLSSGVRIPRVELTPMGPSLDLVLRRYQEADPAVWAMAMKRPKMKKKDVESGLGKKRKNIEVDEMGDMRGRVHIARQDLGKLQTRKMKGLKRARTEDSDDQEEEGE
ncbi:Ribosome production factor 2 homolog [Rhizoctonia solani]|uniref:Ribosome production factor 2 homolog n=1 Tax=Rhizoctonia solani TaxID=456999 RepID=A0A0K6GEQ2_9AGAM|nr:Ribosome production factor 2 homolog [Rhizoctonia solani]